VQILLSERHQGFGVDVRARTSWSHYPPTTQLHSHGEALNPTLTLVDLDPITVVSDLSIAEDLRSAEPDTDSPPGSLHPSQL